MLLLQDKYLKKKLNLKLTCRQKIIMSNYESIVGNNRRILILTISYFCNNCIENESFINDSQLQKHCPFTDIY